jgi:HAE1 family hydrophobic/amphiphilic exporter-1
MKSVVRFSLKQAVFINVIFVLLTVAGVFSLLITPIENMPSVDMGRVIISTVYYGASADDVEKLVTREVEDALDGLENIEYISSKSLRNSSIIDVKFIDDSDYESLYDELRFRVLNIRDELPPEVDEPSFFYIDTQIWMPVIVVDLVGDIPNRSLKLLAEELKADFLNIDGVREIDIAGDYKREFHVSLDPERLRRYGVTFTEAANAISSANTKIPTGRFRKDASEYMLEAGSTLSSQEEILSVVVRLDGDGNFIRIKDIVTTARTSYRDPDVIYSVNGKNAISLMVKKEDNGNSIGIAEEVKAISSQFERLHQRDGVSIRYTWDSTIEIEDSINTLSGNLMLGIFFVMIILWLTLGFRNAMLTAIGLPFSFLCVLTIMHFTNVSINTISIFSFVLVSGIIVDDAVIILENVYRHMQTGKAVKDSIIDGVSEVMLPVVSSALTTIVAFVPMLIMTGSTGEFFAVIPKAVSFALAASLFEALIVLPVHILDWGPRNIPHSMANGKDWSHHLGSGIFAPFWKIYHKILDTFLAHKAITLSSLVVLFVVAVLILVLSVTGIAPLIKVEFFPASFFRYHIPLEMPRGTSIENTDSVVRDISNFINSLGANQAHAVAATAGRYEDEDYTMHRGHHYGQIVVTLPYENERDFPENPDNDLDLHLKYIREQLNEYMDEKTRNGGQKPLFRIFPESTGPPVGKAVNIRIMGNTVSQAVMAADDIMAYHQRGKEFGDLIDLGDNRAVLQKVVKYLPRQEAVFEYGLSPGDITGIVAGTLNGQFAGKFRASDEEVDLLVRLAREDDKGNFLKAGIDDPSDIMDVPVIEHSSAPVFLRDLVNMTYSHEPDMRTRYNGKPTVTVSADIKAGSQLSPGRVQVLTRAYFNKRADKHPGVTLSFGGEFESTSRSYKSLTIAFFIAILGIYVILASQFKDYFQPMIILSAVAFAIIGVSFGMFISRSTFTVGSFLAVIGLAGVAVNDSLILIDFINVRRREGKNMRDAVIEGCSLRMRPVLITTATTILGLLPMAIGIPSKSISWAPMATAFCTGLSSATILTLLIVPVEYELVEKIRPFFSKLFSRE